METIVKAFTGLFFSLLIVYLGVGLISASVEARNADSFAADCVAKIENSNYASEVIKACKEDAKALGYELKIETFQTEGSKKQAYGILDLTYRYAIPIIGLNKEQYICADIR